MNEWDVFMTLASVVGFAAVILPPITRLNSAIARLTVTVEVLTGQLNRHEARLEKLENNKKGAS